jgi:glycosyltransferase involved in cell wall biosynthesis
MSDQTNISAVMLTLNEADVIEDTLTSASPCFDELVIVDGASEDDTVSLAREWCGDHGKGFTVINSSEKEYLLSGVGSQRRKGEDAAFNEYILSIDADSTFEVKDPRWFKQQFEHNAYAHTKVLKCGHVGVEHKLYKLEPDWDAGKYIDAPRMRGMVRERLYTASGSYVTEVFTCPEAPLTVTRNRKEILESESAYPRLLHYNKTEENSDVAWRKKKQHFLLRQTMGSEQQSDYLDGRWKRYFGQNYEMLHSDWEQIAEQYHFPKVGAHESARSIRKNRSDKIRKSPWDLKTYEGIEPVNKMEYDTFFQYVRGEIIN